MTVELLGKEGKRKAIFLVMCMLLALLPMSNVSAEDIGNPNNLQAQDINAVFDPVTETTTVTWRNIDICLLYTSPSPRDVEESRMPSSA